MLRVFGLQFGKSRTEEFPVFVSQLGLSLLCDLGLISFLCLSFLPCQVEMEISTSQVCVKMRTHVIKVPQEMGTCLLYYC